MPDVFRSLKYKENPFPSNKQKKKQKAGNEIVFQD